MFPELIWPLRCLEGTNHRAPRQTYLGEHTYPEWTATRIVLPTIKGEKGSGGILIALPLKSARGATHTTTNGTVLRPDLLLFDDVQTDEVADNPATVRKWQSLIDNTAMMLGGHSQSMAAIMNCTVLREGDLSEIYLDKPGWSRVRYKMLTAKAEQEDALWLGEYASIRRTYNPEVPGDDERAKVASLEFYKQNRAAMDKGAAVTWEWAYGWNDDEPTEISAIQHAYNILIDLGQDTFDCECQNEPAREQVDIARLTATEAARKINSYPRGLVPMSCTKVTAFIDVQGSLLYWVVAAWDEKFTGYIIDYGTWPEQASRYFSLRQARNTLQRRYPGMTDEAAIFAGLQDLFKKILGKNWEREDGATMRVMRCMVDANWGNTSELVNHACRHSPFAGVITPSYGRGIKATHKPISQWQQSQGMPFGPEWTPTKAQGQKLVGVIYDTNYWKKRFSDAFALPIGSDGCITLFKADPLEHQMFADHNTAETPKRTEHGGRVVYEWTVKPGIDEHFGDGGVGCMVAASLCGTRPLEYQGNPTRSGGGGGRRRRRSRQH